MNQVSMITDSRISHRLSRSRNVNEAKNIAAASLQTMPDHEGSKLHSRKAKWSKSRVLPKTMRENSPKTSQLRLSLIPRVLCRNNLP